MIRSIVTTLAAAALLGACGGRVEDEPNPKLEILGGKTSLAFGDTGDELLVGAPRALDIRLTNQASDTRDVRPLKDIVPGVEGAGLSVAHDCPAELAEGEQCTLTVTAAPVVAGSLAGSFRLTSNSDLSPQVYAISGTAVASLNQPAFAWSTGASGAFPQTPPGGSHALTVQAVNRGGAPGTATIVVEPPTGTPFRIDPDFVNTCAVNVGEGATCAVRVLFQPGADGSFEAELVLTDDYRSGYAPLRLPLTGVGKD